MEHPNLDVLRRWFDAFDRSDLGAARTILAADAVLHVSRPAHLKGDYVGFDAFLDFYARKRAAAGDDFHYRVDELLAGDESAAAVLMLSAVRGGALSEWRQVALYRIADGKIARMWIFEDDPE